MEIIILYTPTRCMDKRSDLTKSVPIDASFIQSDDNSPVIIDHISKASLNIAGPALRRAAKLHSGGDFSRTLAPKSLIVNHFHNPPHCLGAISFYDEITHTQRGWLYNSEEIRTELVGRYWAIAMRTDDETDLILSSLKRWEQDCLAEHERANAAEVQLAKLREDVVNYVSTTEAIRGQLLKVQEDFDSQSIELLGIAGELADAKNECAELRERAESAEAEKKRGVAEIQRLNRLVSADSAALASARDEIIALKRKLTDMRGDAERAVKHTPAKHQPSGISSLAAHILAFDRSSLRPIE